MYFIHHRVITDNLSRQSKSNLAGRVVWRQERSWPGRLLLGRTVGNPVRVYELANVGALFVEIGQVLGAKLLVDLELLLRFLFLRGAYIGLTEAVMGIGEIGVEIQRALIFGNCLCEFALV